MFPREWYKSSVAGWKMKKGTGRTSSFDLYRFLKGLLERSLHLASRLLPSERNATAAAAKTC